MSLSTFSAIFSASSDHHVLFKAVKTIGPFSDNSVIGSLVPQYLVYRAKADYFIQIVLFIWSKLHYLSRNNHCLLAVCQTWSNLYYFFPKRSLFAWSMSAMIHTITIWPQTITVCLEYVRHDPNFTICPQMITICLQYVCHDPNYNYDDDDDNEDMDTDLQDDEEDEWVESQCIFLWRDRYDGIMTPTDTILSISVIFPSDLNFQLIKIWFHLPSYINCKIIKNEITIENHPFLHPKKSRELRVFFVCFCLLSYYGFKFVLIIRQVFFVFVCFSIRILDLYLSYVQAFT